MGIVFLAQADQRHMLQSLFIITLLFTYQTLLIFCMYMTQIIYVMNIYIYIFIVHWIDIGAEPFRFLRLICGCKEMLRISLRAYSTTKLPFYTLLGKKWRMLPTQVRYNVSIYTIYRYNSDIAMLGKWPLVVGHYFCNLVFLRLVRFKFRSRLVLLTTTISNVFHPAHVVPQSTQPLAP